MKYLWDFLIVVAGGLVVTFATRFWDSKREAKNRPAKLRENCIEKIQHCINELDFNEKCIGEPTCPFKTKALEQLLNSKEITLLDQDLIASFKQLIEEAAVARAPHMEIVSVRVRSGSKLLKYFLLKKTETLKNYVIDV